MLIAFRVTNFRSFLSTQELSFRALADRAHEATHCVRTGVKAVPRLSRGSILFGPNDGGKTNYILGLATLKDLVLHSSDFREGQLADRFAPFCTQTEAPTGFEIDILLDKVRYRYTVEYNAERITLERLIVNKTGKSQRWFERRFDAATKRELWLRFSSNFTGHREMWVAATHSKALYVTTAARLNSERLAPLFQWFKERVNIVLPRDRAGSRPNPAIDKESFKQSALRLFAALDVPIVDMRVPDRGKNADQVARPPLFEGQHPLPAKPPIWLDESRHGSGVHRLVELWQVLVEFPTAGALTVIDDFDLGLHPLLLRSFVQCVFRQSVIDRQGQVLLTAHGDALMDLHVWRRDQIWLAQLNDEFQSTLTPLTAHHPRKSEPIGKAYLSGRYGAIPDTRPELCDALGEQPLKAERAARRREPPRTADAGR